MSPGADGPDDAVVLVVEDEPAVLEVVVANIGELGYATITASCAHEALDRLRDGVRIDVLFSDVVMPGGMSGVDLAATARRLRPQLKVLLTSGYMAGLDKRQLDGIPVLTKPYMRDELHRSLRAVLDGGAVAPAACDEPAQPH
jgi:CheY-like chemotaxis protein